MILRSQDDGGKDVYLVWTPSDPDWPAFLGLKCIRLIAHFMGDYPASKLDLCVQEPDMPVEIQKYINDAISRMLDPLMLVEEKRY